MTKQNSNGNTIGVRTLWNLNENDIEIDRDDSYFVGLSTGSIPIAIANSRISSESDILKVSIYEDQTWTGGTPYALFNKNRITGAVPAFIVETGPDTSFTPDNDLSLVDPISCVVIRSAREEFGVLQGDSVENNWLFKPNSNYIIRFENTSNNNNRNIDYAIVFDELLYAREV